MPAYYRGIYQNVLKRIDLHLYGSSGGPRMAFVVKPGGIPADISLTFNGQDSLGLDWQGTLKVYLQNKWVELRQAVAYQVGSDGTMTDVNWTATYQLDQGNAVVQFAFGTYDHQKPLVLQIGYLAMGGGGLDTRDMTGAPMWAVPVTTNSRAWRPMRPAMPMPAAIRFPLISL